MLPEKSTQSELTPLKTLFQNMTFLEQFVESVTSYSSKYSSQTSILYAPENLIGKPFKYPSYGDFPETYMLRSYGKWWNESEGAQGHYMAQDIDPIISEDYVTVCFEYAVIPKSISIYETYNPGAVVRLWGRRMNSNWILLWEQPPTPRVKTCNVFRPNIKQIRELVNEIRIDFNQSLLQYHTSIDAILLAGFKPKSFLQFNLLNSGILEQYVTPRPEMVVLPRTVCEMGCDNFSRLPYEAMLHIFQYLDLLSLCRSAQVNQRFYSVSCDATLYRELSLKRYWHKVNNTTLKHFIKRCKQIKKLDISWCGNDKQVTEDIFVQFLQDCCRKITHLSAGRCSFIKVASLKKISSCSDLTDLRLRNCNGTGRQYLPLACLNKLTALDLYSTLIVDEVLIEILMANPDLKHLILDFCECLKKLDQVTETVKMYNKKLVTWSSWKTHTLTSAGVENLSYCSNLHELDVGWCLMLSAPGNCLERVAVGCKDLKRLIICGWRSVSDHLLLSVIRSCKQLTQLDLLGIKNISGAICERILDSLPKLRLLDISFCDSIDEEQVLLWRTQYPDVTIQRSCNANAVL